MGLSLTTRQVGWALALLTAAALALTYSMASGAGHAMDPTHYAPAAILLAVSLAWPFVNGWRPFGGKPAFRTCGACGVQWRPGEDGMHRCPACEAASV